MSDLISHQETSVRFKDLKIGVRMGLGFGLLIVMLLGMMLVSVLRLQEISALTGHIVDIDWAKAEAANVINATTRANGRRTMELVLANDPVHVAGVKAAIELNKKTIGLALETLDHIIDLPEERLLLTQLKEARAKYVQSFSRVTQMVGEGQRDQAIALLNAQTLPALDALQVPINALTDLQKQNVASGSAELRDNIRLARLLVLTLGGLGVVLGSGLAYWLTVTLTRPIGEAVKMARTIASGDLSSTSAPRNQDEGGQLLTALQDMNESLADIVQRVRRGADGMATATSQIAAGNMDLSTRTEQQASALEQTAASMEELADTVKHNFASGSHASELAVSAVEVATRGGTVVAKVVSTMEAIQRSSNEISDIIGLIDGIAFQTNILALNAAVEAARAGEQGRGFAVVASEVRSLAGRSAAAAKQIKDLIGVSVTNVNEGCKLVQQAGSTMDEIVVGVRRVADLMREVTAASQDQTSGISQVNQAVGQMDQVTQQNAALVEEAAAAAQSLEHQAKSLLQTVNVFHFGAGGSKLLALS
jgi:methyl-accepting chemotaxis protein